jgi:hypothetical protein
MAKAKLTPEEKLASKAEKSRLEDKARAQGLLERTLIDLRKKQINDPTILRQVGERVQHGNIKQSVIKEVLDGGKIYLLDEITTNHNYGKPFDTERLTYTAWHDVETYLTPEEIAKIPILSFRDAVSIVHSNSILDSVIHKYYDGTDMDPEYQRGDVWELADKIALIDSIFNNIDIGKLTFIRLPYSDTGPSYEVLDGKQRLRAIIDFFEGRFQYGGKRFCDLHPRDRHHFESYHILYAETEGLTLTQKCEYFLKLNTAGKPQDPAHLKKVKELAGKP